MQALPERSVSWLLMSTAQRRTCTQVITGKLYSDNGSDQVNTLVGSCTETYDSAALITSDTDIDLTSCSVTITNGTKYWFSFDC